MKRIHIALAVICVIALAFMGRVTLADDDAEMPSSKAGIDVSRMLDRALVKEQARDQADRTRKAMEQLEQEVSDFAESTKSPQRLVVTIREVGMADAYTPASDGSCARVGPTPGLLVVTDPSGTIEKELAVEEIPTTARLRSDGVCQAKLTVTVPYAAGYRLAVAIEGRGIASPSDPGPTDIRPKGRSQAVVVLR